MIIILSFNYAYNANAKQQRRMIVIIRMKMKCIFCHYVLNIFHLIILIIIIIAVNNALLQRNVKTPLLARNELQIQSKSVPVSCTSFPPQISLSITLSLVQFLPTSSSSFKDLQSLPSITINLMAN